MYVICVCNILSLFKLNTKNIDPDLEQSALKVYNLYTKNTDPDLVRSTAWEKDKLYYKCYPVSTREWNNSIYPFNKNTLALIPQATISTLKLIKGYFHTYNLTIESKLRKTRLLPRLRRLSSHKIYVSNGEFKHTNDKVIVTLYTYNRQKFNYLSLLDERYLSLRKLNNKLNKRLYLIKSQGLKYLKQANRDKYDIIKILNVFFFNNAKNTAYTESFYVYDYYTKFYLNWVKKSLKKINFYLYSKQLLYLNESLYKYTYLQVLKIYLEKIYNKKVEFNLINLKYHYLNSDILSESITLKITRNRRKLLNYLNKLIWKVNVYKTDKNVYKAEINKLNLIKTIDDPVENLLNNKPRSDREDSKKVVLDEIKYKRLGGVRLEASGRLTKRYTASRSATRLRYKGNLINTDSSYKGLSTVLLKGNLKSNIQYSELKSKTRIGSFGVKTWVSGN